MGVTTGEPPLMSMTSAPLVLPPNWSMRRGWTDDVDVIFTTDHGELQGDFGLLYKGPFHTDALMRLPLVWRPAPSAGVAPAVVTDPVPPVFT